MLQEKLNDGVNTSVKALQKADASTRLAVEVQYGKKAAAELHRKTVSMNEAEATSAAAEAKVAEALAAADEAHMQAILTIKKAHDSDMLELKGTLLKERGLLKQVSQTEYRTSTTTWQWPSTTDSPRPRSNLS